MTYCASHDPIVAAGYITCGACGTDSWPAEAEWITPELILAAFDQTHAPACPGRHTACGTVLLDATIAGAGHVPAVTRPRLCRGTTVAGRACRAYAQAGSGYCAQHRPDRQRAR